MKKIGNNARLLTIITALIIVLLTVVLGELLGTVHDSLHVSTIFFGSVNFIFTSSFF